MLLYPTVFAIPVVLVLAASVAEALVSLVFLTAIPSLHVLWCAAAGKVDIDISGRSERLPFLSTAAASQAAAVGTLWLLNSSSMLALAMAYFLITLALIAITTVWKISVHCAGVAGPVTALIWVFGWPALPTLVLIPLIIYARFALYSHTLNQCIAGALLAALLTAAIFWLFGI